MEYPEQNGVQYAMTVARKYETKFEFTSSPAAKELRNLKDKIFDPKKYTITEEHDYDTAPIALRNRRNFSKACTPFSGCDAVPIVNGKVLGTLQSITKDVDGEGNGSIDIVAVVFQNTNIIENGSIMVIVYANEYGCASYEIIRLDKLKRHVSSIDVSSITIKERMSYSGRVLCNMTPVPKEVIDMSTEDFKKMVDRTVVTESDQIGDNLGDSLANRVYYWLLDSLGDIWK